MVTFSAFYWFEDMVVIYCSIDCLLIEGIVMIVFLALLQAVLGFFVARDGSLKVLAFN